MKNIVTNTDIDLIMEILRQARPIKAAVQKEESNNTLSSKEIEYNNSPRSYLKGPDTDGGLMLSRKNRKIYLQKKDEYFQEIKKHINDILNRLTEQDYKKLLDEGFQVEDLTVESLAGAIKMIKDFNNINKEKKEEASPKNKDKKISDDELNEKMKAYNIPVSDEAKDRIKEALNLSESIQNIEKKDILYLIGKNLPPTIENIYKARYSSKNNEANNKLSDADWDELIPKVSDFLNKVGIQLSNDTLDKARWLVENNLSLSKENINYITGLEKLARNYDKGMILERIFKGMGKGILPGDVPLLDENIEDKDVNRLLEDIHSINDEDIINSVKDRQEINIKNLVNSKEAEELDVEQEYEKMPADQKVKFITAKKQLEEIRLKMTAEAALRLEKKGFSIDTKPLEEVVEKLRQEEESYYKELLEQAEIKADEEKINLLRNTTESLKELKIIPAHVLGATLYDIEKHTISGLIGTGRSILIDLEKAKESYEALFTQPRTDYGDSIQKAFDNMESLMEEMGIEDTSYNKRAIRILGYNRMEITKEAIEEVKAYDLQVNYLIKNMTPALAVKIIKDGLNPMDLPIEELNYRLDKIREEESFSSIEKYSTYLYKLEKESKISEAERKAYIGIYRLLYQIEKSDGAALGAVIKSEREVTLNNLLTALRTMKKGKMDYNVDDNFGGLKELSFEKENISDQLGAVFSEQASQRNIHRSIIKQLLEEMNPGKLQRLHINNTDEEVQAQQNLWDTLGNMPIEKLLDQIKAMETNPGDDQAYFYEKLNQLRKIYENCDQAIHFLNNFKIPCTTGNLIMAEQILNNSMDVYKKLLHRNLKKKSQLTDKLIDKKTINEAYEQLEQEAKDIIEEKAKADDIDSFKLNELRNMGLQMQFIKTLGKREFYQLPLEMSGKLTNINLTIIRGKSDAGKVTVTLSSDKLGNIKAEARLKENTLSGYFACDHKDSISILKTKEDLLNSLLKEENLEIKQLNFYLQQAAKDIYGYQNTWESEGSSNPETERILYRVAKALIYMIKTAEEEL